MGGWAARAAPGAMRRGPRLPRSIVGGTNGLTRQTSTGVKGVPDGTSHRVRNASRARQTPGWFVNRSQTIAAEPSDSPDNASDSRTRNRGVRPEDVREERDPLRVRATGLL